MDQFKAEVPPPAPPPSRHHNPAMAKQKGKAKGKSNQSNKSNGSSTMSSCDGRGGKAQNKQKQKHHGHQNTSSSSTDDTQFRNNILNQGNTIIDMKSDGNCLFRSLSDQLYHDSGSKHDVVRDEICNHLSQNKETFECFLLMEDDDEDIMDFEEYVAKMRGDGEWGGNVELYAASRVYRRSIRIYSSIMGVWMIDYEDDGGEKKTGNGSNRGGCEEEGGALLLSHHDGDHYNSVHPINKSSNSKQSTKMGEATTVAKGGGDTTKNRKHKASDVKQNKHDSVLDNDTRHATSNASPIELDITSSTTRSRPPRKGADCPCGSGIKYKKCCLAKEKALKRSGVAKEEQWGDGNEEKDEKKDGDYIGDFKVLTI